ncbi:MAG: fibrobacter succinogenes major paralogous domain-containing protein [Dysgonamonadaceae bacterium]|nr:fibrobacter succinogenes major paralogous domain-containing protein [Dysgonamonadaceae bacterium]
MNSATTGGLVLSNVDLTDLSVIPANTFVNISTQQDTNQELAGMIVYNTNAATGVGVHFWDGEDWIKPCAPPAPGPIIFSSSSLLAGVKYAARVAPVAGATSYVWTLPPAFTVFGTSDGATITFSAPSGTYPEASIVVRAKNACGESSRRYVGTQQIAVTAISGCNPLPPTPLITSDNVAFADGNGDVVHTHNGITFSAPIKIIGKGAKTSLPSTSNSLVDYSDHAANTNLYGSWFTWCMVARYNDILCPDEWHVPTQDEFVTYAGGSSPIALSTLPSNHGWLTGGCIYGSSVRYVGTSGAYWSSTLYVSLPDASYNADAKNSSFYPQATSNHHSGASLRCVR